MAEISRGQVNLNTVLGALGTAGAVIPGVLGNLIGGGGAAMPNMVGSILSGAATSENQPVNRYELGLIQENAALKTQVEMHKAEIYTDNKMEKYDEKYERRFRGIEDQLAQQAVYNATNTATLGCMGQQISGLQAVLAGITKTVVSKDAICPEVMPRYNSWVAPTETASAGT